MKDAIADNMTYRINCLACEREAQLRNNPSLEIHTCGNILSKLTLENIKRAARQANQEQRDLMALPSWEKIIEELEKQAKLMNSLHYRIKRIEIKLKQYD